MKVAGELSNSLGVTGLQARPHIGSTRGRIESETGNQCNRLQPATGRIQPLHRKRQTFTVVLADTGKPGAPPVGRRLARLLKIAGRGMALKCLAVTTEPPTMPRTARGCDSGVRGVSEVTIFPKKTEMRENSELEQMPNNGALRLRKPPTAGHAGKGMNR